LVKLVQVVGGDFMALQYSIASIGWAMNPSSVRIAEFMDLCGPCQRRLFGYIVLMVGDTTAAHDILQDTNLFLWQKFDQFQPGTNFFAFAKEVARYRVLRYQHIHSQDAVLLEPDTLELLTEVAINEASDRSESQRSESHREALAACIGKLSVPDADLIRRRYEPGFSVRTVAEQMGRSENALSQSLARIRRVLRSCIERTLADQGMDYAS
jgi:RNA polymerase sigma-70 factor (ECF subfamily)